MTVDEVIEGAEAVIAGIPVVTMIPPDEDDEGIKDADAARKDTNEELDRATSDVGLTMTSKTKRVL